MTTWMNIALVAVVGLIVAAGAVFLLAKFAKLTIREYRAMRAAGADTKEAAEKRVQARARRRTLIGLVLFATVPAALSYAHLVDYATHRLMLSHGLEFLVPLALDEAAMYLLMLAFQDVDADESSLTNRLLVWAFVGGSAWFNWQQAPHGPGSQGAPFFFAGMSIATGVLFERGLSAVRRQSKQAKGRGRQPLPQVSPLRWLSSPRETLAAMRLAVEEPSITTLEQALGAVRMRRAISQRVAEARRQARRQALASRTAKWYQIRQVYVTTAQPVLAIPTGTAVSAVAAVSVLAPYAVEESAQIRANKGPAPLMLGPIIETAHNSVTSPEQMAQLENRLQSVEDLAADADAALMAQARRLGRSLGAPTLPAPRAEAAEAAEMTQPASTEDLTEVSQPAEVAETAQPVPALDPAEELPLAATAQLADVTESADSQARAGEQGQTAVRGAVAEQPGPSGRVTVRVPQNEHDDEDGEPVDTDLTRHKYKIDRVREAYWAHIAADDPRNYNAITADLLEIVKEQYGEDEVINRSYANKVVKRLHEGRQDRAPGQKQAGV